MARLVLMFKDRVIRELQLTERTLRIGRDPDNDVQLDNAAVSRNHAEIYRQGYPYYIEDKDSTNGTFVNGRFLNWKIALNNNDRIQIGKNTLVFVEEAKDIARHRVTSYEASETILITAEDQKGPK